MAMGALLAAEGASMLPRRVEVYWGVRSYNNRAKELAFDLEAEEVESKHVEELRVLATDYG